MVTDARISLFHLLAERRLPEAERQLRRMLIADPSDAPSRALRALVLAELERWDEAADEARLAAGTEPELAYAHRALGHVLAGRHRYAQALPAARRAAELDPDDADHWSLLARVLIARGRWAEGLEAADRGLEADPDHAGCANLRALALQRHGTPAEADQAYVDALSLDTGNAFARAGRGWMALRQGHAPDAAVAHFQHALEIDPGSEWARDGLLAALKARNPVYRAILRYFLWMQSLGPRTRWLVVVGGIVGFNQLRRLARAEPALVPVIYPVLGLYALFVLLNWTADPVFDFLLRFDPVGRTLIPRDRERASFLVVGTLGAAVSAALAGAATGRTEAWLLAMALGFVVIPLAGTFRCEPGWPRLSMGAYTAVVATLGIVGALLPGGTGDTLLVFSILGSVLGSWLVQGLASVTPRR